MSTKTKTKGQAIFEFRSDCKTQRVRYYHGMLLREQEFIEEQRYHYDQRRHANAVLHGFGIVDGLLVSVDAQRLKLKIGRGSAIDDCGRVVQVCEDLELCISKMPPMAGPDETCDCGNADKNAKGEATKLEKWLVLCHVEREVNPRPAYRTDVECADPKPCEHSRIEEGYEIRVVDLADLDPFPCENDPVSEKTPEQQCAPAQEGQKRRVPNLPPAGERGDAELEDRESTHAEDPCGWATVCGRPLPTSSCVGCCGCCGCSCIILGRLVIQLDACNQVKQLCYSPHGRRNALGLALLREVYVDLCRRITALDQYFGTLKSEVKDLVGRVAELEANGTHKENGEPAAQEPQAQRKAKAKKTGRQKAKPREDPGSDEEA